jgi:hypothetical protein
MEGQVAPSQYDRLTAKADALLAEGDRLAEEGKMAESRRILRECLRCRRRAKANREKRDDG